MLSLNPYLAFDGNCEAAFEFYRSIFGGDLSPISRFSEMPPGSGIAPEQGQLVMHVSVTLGDGQALMGSDRPPGTGATTRGDSVAISVNVDSAEEGRRIFDALAEGGSVTVPYEHQFWGDDYGACTDRFGIPWMVDHRATTP